MRRRTLAFAMGLLLAAAACGPAEVVVTMEIEAPNPEGEGMVTRTLSDIEVQLLPYDRDQVFDSMTTAFGTPEPEIPQDLLDAREEIAAAQQRWRNLENRWNTLRDTLQTLTEAMEQYNRGEAQYRMLFNEFNDLDAEYGQVERQMEAAFNEFDELEKANLAYAQEVRIQRDNWADEAFQSAGEIMVLKERESGLRIAADTTDASGVAVFDVPPGDYWVVGWLEEVYTELYWNIPVTVTKGEPVTVTLSRSNAQIRTKL